MISRFGVKNYKALADIDIPLTNIHVVIGQNDSGKTSLLEAINAFCRSAYPNQAISNAFDGKWQGRELVYFGSKDPAIEFSARLDGLWKGEEFSKQYGFKVAFDPSSEQTCNVASEWCSNGEKVLIPRGHKSLTTVSYRFHVDEPTKGSYPLDEISGMVSPANFYRFDAKSMAIPATIDEKRKFRMEHDGFGLPTLLDDILGYDAEIFIKLSKEFCSFFPEFKRVRVQTEMASQRNYSQSQLQSSSQSMGKGVYFETSDGGLVRAQQASDGALLFLGFLSLLYLPTPPKVLLIEEPEKGVYPKRLEEIVNLLKRVIQTGDRREIPQIILTTHSPYVLSLFTPEEVTLLSRRGDHVIARPLRDAPNIEERLNGGDFYLGELWYNLDEEELFGNARAEHRH